jgi:integrase
MRLTDQLVADLACPASKKDVLVGDDGCTGLAVRVTASGTKVFLFNHRVGRYIRRQRLGLFGADLTLAQARRKVEALRGAVLDGRDPVAERRAARAQAEAARAEAGLTVGRLLDDFLRLHLASKRSSYRRDVEGRLRLHLKPLLQRPCGTVTRKEAVQEIDRIRDAAGLTTARRVLQYARTMFAWASKRGAVESNPFAGVPAPGTVVFRERVLVADEIGAVWRATSRLGHPHGPFVRFLLLSLARREEVAAMTWGEVTTDLSLWTVPGSRMKRGLPHVVHLSEPAREVLRAIPRGGPDQLVFATLAGRRLTTYAWIKRVLDREIARENADAARSAGLPPPVPLRPWVLHDFRRSGVSALAAMGFDVIVADKLLAHQPSALKGASGVYQRHAFAEERKRALDAWAAHMLRHGEGEAPAGNVVRLAESVV